MARRWLSCPVVAGPLTRLCTRGPGYLLVALLVATLALAAYAVGVPERLALGGGELAGSESEELDARLAAELGYEPEPGYLLLLSSQSAVPPASADVAREALETQVTAIDGVGAIGEPIVAADDSTLLLPVHLDSDVDAPVTESVGEALSRDLDPGPFELLVGGTLANQEQARESALDEAPKLLALAAPLLLLLLVAALGWRPGLAALLGGALAAAAALALLGLVGELTTISASAAIVAPTAAAVLAIEAGAALLVRYREEAATLGGGPEAFEYTLHAVLESTVIAVIAALPAALALLFVPIDFVRSIGAGLGLALLVGPVLGLLALAALLGLRARQEVGEALPLVPDDARAQQAPGAFRGLLVLGRTRSRGLLALLPLAIALALALPLLDSDAVGLSAEQLPAGTEAAEAGEQLLASDLPAGASGPLLIGTSGPAEAPTVTIYRDSVAGLEGVAAVGEAETVGDAAVFEALGSADPQSLEGQRTAVEARRLASPSPSTVGGQPAELLDSAGRLGADLPLLAGLALLAAALLLFLLLRAPFAPLLALSAAPAPLAGLAAMLGVFGDDRLTGLLDYSGAGAPHLQSFVLVGATLLAVGLHRAASFGAVLREERSLGGGAAGSLARCGALGLRPALAATVAGVLVAGVWVAGDLLPGKEIALGLSAGLLADLLLARTLLAPALARLGL